MLIHRKGFIIFLSILFLFSHCLNATAQGKPIVCKQAYALCTSAPCIPDPRHPDYAVCSCVVEKGESAGFKTCAERVPKQKQFNTTQLTSTFSFEQFSTKKSINCEKGMPWTNCVDAPCTVDPMNPTKAICSCKIDHTQAFFTFGGDCDTKTCATGFWSGATTAAGVVFQNAMFEKLNITKNPWPNNACQK